MLTGRTPTELADLLDEVGEFGPSTAALSALAEATGPLREAYPQIEVVWRVFDDARYSYKRSGRSAAAWAAAVAAARDLAAAIRNAGADELRGRS